MKHLNFLFMILFFQTIIAQQLPSHDMITGSFTTPTNNTHLLFTQYFQEHKRFLLIADSHHQNQDFIRTVIQRCRKKKSFSLEELILLHNNLPLNQDYENSVLLVAENKKLFTSSRGSLLSIRATSFHPYRSDYKRPKHRVAESKSNTSSENLEIQAQRSHDLIPGGYVAISFLFGAVSEEVHDHLTRSAIEHWLEHRYCLTSITRKEQSNFHNFITTKAHTIHEIIQDYARQKDQEGTTISTDFDYRYLVLNNSLFFPVE